MRLIHNLSAGVLVFVGESAPLTALYRPLSSLGFG